jgi:hypothetical protein
MLHGDTARCGGSDDEAEMAAETEIGNRTKKTEEAEEEKRGRGEEEEPH